MALPTLDAELYELDRRRMDLGLSVGPIDAGGAIGSVRAWALRIEVDGVESTTSVGLSLSDGLMSAMDAGGAGGAGDGCFMCGGSG